MKNTSILIDVTKQISSLNVKILNTNFDSNPKTVTLLCDNAEKEYEIDEAGGNLIVGL